MFPRTNSLMKCQALAVALVLWSGVVHESLRGSGGLHDAVRKLDESLSGAPSIPSSVRDQPGLPSVTLFERSGSERLWRKTPGVQWLVDGANSAIPSSWIVIDTFAANTIIPRESPPLCDVARHERSGVLLA